MTFTVPKLNSNLPIARFGTQNLLIIDRTNEWLVVVAIDQNVRSGDYLIYFRYDDEDAQALSIPFAVEEKNRRDFGEDDTFFEDRQPARPTVVWPRNLSAIDFENSSESKLPFSLPNSNLTESIETLVERSRSTPREATALGGQVRNDTTLLAPSQAIVANLIYSEDETWTLILDHGRSTYSLFSFQGEANVTLGSGVDQGQPIAELTPSQGDTNYPQPDLYWWVSLNGAIISPSLLLEWQSAE